MGYYARARHLHQAAKIIVEQHGGKIPASYIALRALPGIGPYTAGAIASIAFNLPHIAVDGNVRRVLARYRALRNPTPAFIQALASQVLDQEACGEFNQALMELGAVVCTPRNPQCPNCPLHKGCEAAALGQPEQFPEKKRKAPIPHYDIAASIIRDHQGRFLIQRRAETALLGGLWELPGGKRQGSETLQQACARELREELGVEVVVGEKLMSINHAYSHFRITLHAFWCKIVSGTPQSSAGLPLRWVRPEGLIHYAFPRANRRILDQLTHG